jgi:putative transposase
MKFDPQKPFDYAQGRHHRRSIRVPDYDYSQPGAYFITIVTRGRECLFGEITKGEMHLSAMGQIAEECWRLIPEHFPSMELGVYVVMPNHVHGIIVMRDRSDADASERRGTIYRAPTNYRAPTERFQKPVAGSIPTVIRTYKASVTRRIGREFNATGIWQRNYYEHIVRNDEEYNRIHLYIEANVANWVTDNENPVKST